MKEKEYRHHYVRNEEETRALSVSEKFQIEGENRVIKLAWDYYLKFGDAALEVLKEQYFNEGLKYGEIIKKDLNISDDKLESVVRVVETYFSRVGLNIKYKIEGNKASYEPFHGFCPVYYAIKTLELPPEKICPNTGWAFFSGIVSSVNPKAKMFLRSWRWKNPEGCSEGIMI